ncbi:hypothetical protein GGF32_000278 [Allomyces javanicus]|nr:hypothetical protein GGF32_000278 [Allomyces javanicus]
MNLIVETVYPAVYAMDPTKVTYAVLQQNCLIGPLKVVTSAGKVSTRAATAAACTAVGMKLADVTLANLDDMIKVMRKSPDIKMNPMDSVSSWSGDSYGGVDLQMTVRANKGAVALVTALAYLTCQRP